MIKYKIEGDNADELRKLVGNYSVESKKENQVKDNGKCPVCGGSDFSKDLVSEKSYSNDNHEYAYHGKQCKTCNFIKPNKLGGE